MTKVVIADDRQGIVLVIKATNISAAKKRIKRFKDSHFMGSDISENFDYEVVDLI